MSSCSPDLVGDECGSADAKGLKDYSRVSQCEYEREP